ncbi:MAG: transcriptional regulator [Candidatus Marinimicrobia bacterium]|nr:transcriptional regulator [Candidatus Neomarinimicrobiota bacterium]|tara:strand:- start:1159 stop:1533 length:375 start_codon:yes stop_codon:yes gene_type:complete
MIKKKLSKEKLDYFKEIILQKREKIMDDIAQSKERTEDMMKNESVNAIYSSHMADAGSDQQEREKAFYWLSRENSYFQYLNRALDMINDGTFGICKICGEIINEERLIEVPHTTKCFSCKSNSQ